MFTLDRYRRRYPTNLTGLKILPVPYKLSVQDTSDHRRLQGVFEK